jgi:site-specific DNA-methyltransferase (cytosine-N4-specific)
MDSDWTFEGASTRDLTHCYHDYPARMIPQIAGKLLDLYAQNAALLFDPYCGTGTSLVEALVRGIDGVGTDLNPLARLIARAKTHPPALRALDEQIIRFHEVVCETNPIAGAEPPEIPGITRVDFWFKPDVATKLLRIKEFVEAISDEAVRNFFQVAFSETVRESSNSRNGEFKLYRYDSKKLERFNPDVDGKMRAKLKRNRSGLEQFQCALRGSHRSSHADIFDFDTVKCVPAEVVRPASVDIVVTSPPYGDSHTTVAYGQYSRLPAAWLGLNEPDKIDRKLMGERPYKITEFRCEALRKAIDLISDADEKRAREVSAFYQDLYDSISHVAEVIRPGGYACYVVGNRKVKGVVLPTDLAVRSFFEEAGFTPVDTFHRSIPNKRMPLRNSPTNVGGVADSTILREYIVVMRRPGLPAG